MSAAVYENGHLDDLYARFISTGSVGSSVGPDKIDDMARKLVSILPDLGIDSRADTLYAAIWQEANATGMWQQVYNLAVFSISTPAAFIAAT